MIAGVGRRISRQRTKCYSLKKTPSRLNQGLTSLCPTIRFYSQNVHVEDHLSGTDMEETTNVDASQPRFSIYDEVPTLSDVVDTDAVNVDALIDELPEDDISQEHMLKPISEFKPLKDSFAIIHIGGKQFKVTSGDEIMVSVMENVEIDDHILLDKILLVGTRGFTAVGQPILTKAKILASVEEHSLGVKELIFKKKRRKGYQRLRGARHPYTLLHIHEVLVDKSVVKN
eukprot:TRINITY_DN10748_c0_g1_i1.p1 TRINITY_DN10748_c0_g1~~TRINITY_DN10748_c0_g1_i1.p1  ORF type:complete len:229 (+),score=46.45 TRINITY_DN10748_c0_g1_i1:73-759(+)